MMRTRIIYLLALLPLMGCKLGQRFQQPDLNMPQAYTTQAESQLAEMKWWQVYADTTLQHLIRQAIDYNKDILASEARIREMEARKRISMAQFFPNISGQAYAQNEALNYGGDNSVTNPEHGIKLGVLWELDLWGGKRWRHDLNKAQWREAIETNHYLMVSIISDVAVAYYQLLALDAELQTVRTALIDRFECLNLAMADTATTATLAMEQAQLEYDRMAVKVPMLERDIKLKENELSFLCGQYPGKVERDSHSDSEMVVDSLPTGLSSTLLERRPDIKAAKERLIAANASIGIAYTDRFPTFSLSAIGGLESDELKTLLKSPMHFFSPGIRFPVFDLGQLNAEYRASKHAYDAVCQDYEKTVLSAFREVSDGITTYNKCNDIYMLMLMVSNSASAAYNTSRSMYGEGKIGYATLLIAQRDSYKAQIDVIEAERDRHLALITLYKALGGGWQ